MPVELFSIFALHDDRQEDLCRCSRPSFGMPVIPFNVLSCTKMMNSWRKAQKHGISREISHGAKNKAGIFHYGELFGRYSRQQAAEVHKALLHSWWMPLYVGTFSFRPGLQREMQIFPIDCWKKLFLALLKHRRGRKRAATILPLRSSRTHSEIITSNRQRKMVFSLL